MAVLTWAWANSVELPHGDFQGLVLRREKLGRRRVKEAGEVTGLRKVTCHSPRPILSSGAVTAPQVPPLLELMIEAGFEWRNPLSHTFLGSDLSATFR